jgi:hemoglobin-like flavoprotein
MFRWNTGAQVVDSSESVVKQVAAVNREGLNMDVSRVRRSFSEVRPTVSDAVAFFCDKLLTSAPELRPIFEPLCSVKNRFPLAQAIIRVVDGSDNLEETGKYLRSLGRPLHQAGFREEHCAHLARAMIATLRHYLKEGWSAELEDQWILLLGFAADQILEGAREPKKLPKAEAKGTASTPVFAMDLDSPSLAKRVSQQKVIEPTQVPTLAEVKDLHQLVRLTARNLLQRALEEEMDGEFMRLARRRAASALAQAVREEADLLQTSLDSSRKTNRLKSM